MAKTRRPAKKRGSPKPKRSKPAKKASVKPAKPKKKTVTAKAVQNVELKELRKQFASVLGVLSARRSSSPEKEAKLDDTRRRISQWMTDIDDICTPEDHDICGPDMAFPIP